MSYQISYGKMPQETTKKSYRCMYRAAGIAIGLAVIARVFYPSETKQLTDALFPLTSASAQEALEGFAQNIKAGETFGDAVTTFCLEIIDDADNS